jgi:hypothetical protein
MASDLDPVRSIYTAWVRGDFRLAEWADPEIEYVMADGPLPGGWKGLAGMAEAARKGLDAWGDVRFRADEYRELDDERVLVLEHRSGRGKTSGLELGELEAQGAHLFYIRQGNQALRPAGPRPRVRPPGLHATVEAASTSTSRSGCLPCRTRTTRL